MQNAGLLNCGLVMLGQPGVAPLAGSLCRTVQIARGLHDEWVVYFNVYAMSNIMNCL